MDFDETRLYYSHQALQQQRPEDDAAAAAATNADENENVHLPAVRRHFREFLRELKCTQ
jgi:hypothetical protein